MFGGNLCRNHRRLAVVARARQQSGGLFSGMVTRRVARRSGCVGGFYSSLCRSDDLVRLCRAIPARKDGDRGCPWASALRGSGGGTGDSGYAEASHAGLAASLDRSHRCGYRHVRPGIGKHLAGNCRGRSLWWSVPARRFRSHAAAARPAHLSPCRNDRGSGLFRLAYRQRDPTRNPTDDQPWNSPGWECVLSERSFGVWRRACCLTACSNMRSCRPVG